MGGMAIQPIATILILNMVGKEDADYAIRKFAKETATPDCLTCI